MEKTAHRVHKIARCCEVKLGRCKVSSVVVNLDVRRPMDADSMLIVIRSSMAR